MHNHNSNSRKIATQSEESGKQQPYIHKTQKKKKKL
jgi:hypothetical protein